MPSIKTFFSIFDQYQDTQVDLTEYLNRFSKSENPIQFSNMQPVVVSIKNIFEQVQLAEDFMKNNLVGFEKYTISDGERIETVANELYGTKEYWWVIAMFNDLTNLFTQWPMTNDQLVTLATKLTTEEGIYPFDTYFRILFEKNEAKRQITFLKNVHLGSFIWDIRKKVIEKNKQGILV